jgi:hypothetical protein
MKIDDLTLFNQPPRYKAQRECVACKAFAATCLVPVGEGAMPMCWLCAHHVIEHDEPLHNAHAAGCGCLPADIYPASVLATRPSNDGGSEPVAPVAKRVLRR